MKQLTATDSGSDERNRGKLTAIHEVPLPGTKAGDRGIKADLYQNIPTI